MDVTLLSPHVGAEIAGVDLGDLDDATFAEIERLFVERGALFFRDQDIEPDEHLAFARRFGPLEVYPFKAGNVSFSPHPAGVDEIVRLEHDHDRPGYENAWHSDVTWMVEPSLGSVLRAIELPPVGGDTLFSDCRAVYDSLDSGWQEQLEGLSAHHDWLEAFGTRLPPGQLAKFREQHPGADHPVIRTHPVSGRKAIYVNGAFTRRVDGHDYVEFRLLMNHLEGLVARPEFQCRFRWEPGSIAMWDNRWVQHYAVNDYWPNRRVMDRVTIAGDKPF